MLFTKRLPLLIGLAVIGVSGAAQAEVNFQGFTDGCYATGAVCTPVASSAQSVVTAGGLTYENSTFNATTAGDFLGVGAQGQPSPIANFNNFGSFTLSGMPFDYTAAGLNFDALISFTAPPGTTPGTGLFTDKITGRVLSNVNGGVFIDFDNTFQNFTYTGGTFSVNVNDVSLTAGNTVALTGNIFVTETAVDEPSSLALLAAGAGMLGMVAYRRRRAG